MGDSLIRPACEVCGCQVEEWRVAPDCVLERCSRCGHITRDLSVSPANARGIEYGGDPVADKFRTAITFRRLRGRLHDLQHVNRVVDVGCGPAAPLARDLVGAGKSVIALDPHASRDHTFPGLQIERGGVGDLTNLLNEADWDGADLVTAIHVLEHVPDVSRAIAAMFAATSPGGHIYALTPNADCSGLTRWGTAWWMLEDPTHVRFFTATSLRLALESAGYRSVRVRRLVLDSLMTDGATLMRHWSPAARPEGVLATGRNRAAVMATIPIAVANRAARPNARPVLEVTATRSPDGAT